MQIWDVYLPNKHIKSDRARREGGDEAGTHLINPKKEMSAKLTTQPAAAKALGIVRAPVPTIRLNMYTNPTWRGNHGG